MEKNNPTEQQIRTLAIHKVIEEEFTDLDVRVILVSALQVIFNDDDTRILRYLENQKDKLSQMNKN